MARANILLAGVEEDSRRALLGCLNTEEYNVVVAGSGAEAARHLERAVAFDLLLLDLERLDLAGREVLAGLLERDMDLPVVVVACSASLDEAVDSMRRGALDYIERPLRDDVVALRVARAIEVSRARARLGRLQRNQTRRFNLRTIIGKPDASSDILRAVERAIQSADESVLVRGEAGTGRGALARIIHQDGPRGDRPFVEITCTTGDQGRIVTELFGSERNGGANGGANGPVTQRGLLELADGGTLFVDEIATAGPELQEGLLRFLDEGTITRVGGSQSVSTSVRVIVGTSDDIESLVEGGRFREDLARRLSVNTMELPPLRERKGDLAVLVEHFILHLNRELGRSVEGANAEALARLAEHDWPGNLDELSNAIERALVFATSDRIEAEDISPAFLEGKSDAAYRRRGCLQLTREGLSLENLERDLVQQALDLTHGNQTQAGRLLGLNRDQIRYRVEKFGLILRRDLEKDREPS